MDFIHNGKCRTGKIQTTGHFVLFPGWGLCPECFDDLYVVGDSSPQHHPDICPKCKLNQQAVHGH